MSKETVEFTFEKMDKYFDAAKQVLEQYAPDAVDIGLNALRVEAFSTLFPWGILALLSVIYYTRYFKKYINWVVIKCKDDMEPENYWGPFITINIPVLVLAIMSFIRICDIWSWVGVFYPELYAVHKFLL